MAVWCVQEGANRSLNPVNEDEQQGPALSDYDPSWMQDGYGITGDQGEPDLNDDTQWDTNAWSRDQQQDDFTGAGGSCLPSSPPDTGTSVWGSIDGVCQWIDTTTCP